MGSWWQLYDTYVLAEQLQTQWRTQPLPACPNDGEPLLIGPDGVRYCRYDGFRETERRETD